MCGGLPLPAGWLARHSGAEGDLSFQGQTSAPMMPHASDSMACSLGTTGRRILQMLLKVGGARPLKADVALRRRPDAALTSPNMPLLARVCVDGQARVGAPRPVRG